MFEILKIFRILAVVLVISNNNWANCSVNPYADGQDCSKSNGTRLMYWYGKVNQHNDRTTGFSWQTDCDGTSGANLDPIEYCKKFQPSTTHVRNCSIEQSKTWRDRGNTGGPYTNPISSTYIVTYECLVKNPDEKVPRIMMWQGKVNQHNDITTGWSWQTDCDGVSGAMDKLVYCKALYPKTVSVRQLGPEVSTTWRDRGNTGGPYTNTQVIYAYQCVQG